jgi:hypothetical protein
MGPAAAAQLAPSRRGRARRAGPIPACPPPGASSSPSVMTDMAGPPGGYSGLCSAVIWCNYPRHTLKLGPFQRIKQAPFGLLKNNYKGRECGVTFFVVV